MDNTIVVVDDDQALLRLVQKELQRLGYNENHIRTAGYSLGEMIMAGLAKQTRDHVKGQ